MNTFISSPNSPCLDSYQPHLLRMKSLLIIFFAFEMICSSTSSPGNPQESDHTTRGIFVFGDSAVDAGNNNYIPLTIAKGNYFPYGIDFPGGISPTGRYTNGRTVVDIIGEELGLKHYIPPYLAPTTVGDVVLRGVNYASGGAGILAETGAIFGCRINMDEQLDNFANTRNYIISKAHVGGSSKAFLRRSLFMVVIGSNDIIGYNFSPIPLAPAPKLMSLETYVESLISKFRLQLTRLYDLDARKIVVANVGPVGCAPIEKALNPLYTTGGSCISYVNNPAVLFNKKLKSLLMELNSKLVEPKFVYADSYSLYSHLIDHYKSYGFENYNSPCCNILAGAFRAYNNSETKAIFVFGGSLVDPGNNNRLMNFAKYNMRPNGIDFPGGIPTGRYTNGKTAIDLVGQALGLKNFIPPYNDPTTTGEVVLLGVNYASGGSGILDHSGFIYGDRFSMDEQIENFANTMQYIISRIGSITASKLLSKALFSVGTGSNDFAANYFTPFILIPEQKLTPLQVFVDSLISKYQHQLTRLYEFGARKFVIQNIPPIGCTPSARELNNLWNKNSCVASMNNAVMLFNTKLKALLFELNSNLAGSKFVYADIYHIALDLINNYQSYGFENNDSACCRGFGSYGGLGLCRPTSEVCSDRTKYIFWDLGHPSEAVNLLVSKRLLDGDSKDIYPMNIRQLYNR
ncbi:hypothetical protein MKW94_025592 [Papaver nudicaule]|uniref:Uncharacterized protein n=1 Tax=Papaver nudicaule TaxID=74823 RepID=A0AA41VG82_PAPNU|nr:hypothetical protein [Papaver nudicaule]